MKKLLFVLFSAVLSLVCFAEGETYATAGDLYQASAGIYPDYICGVWSSDGGMSNLTFSVLNNEDGEKGKEAIFELVEDDSTVSFEYGEFSYNYLSKVQEDLLPYMEKNIGLVSSGVYDMENRIGLGILTEMKDNPKTLAMLEELNEKYGDIFFIEYTEGYVTYDDVLTITAAEEILTEEENKDNTVWYIIFGAIGVIVASAVIICTFKKRK